MKNNLLSETELIEYAKGENLIDRLRGLLDHQKDNWDLVKNNYKQLNSVIIKSVIIDGIEIKLQINPKRVKSTSADLTKTTTENECILCNDNLPEQQKFIRYYKEYNFLVNPYPIFSEHFTVVKNKHTPQSILTYLNDLLLISRDVGERYLIFYNGPECGASIPHHLHFQMGNKNAFPLLHQIQNLEKKVISLHIRKKKIDLLFAELTNRFFLLLKSSDPIEILNCFSVVMNSLRTLNPKTTEPMMNILCDYENKKWQLIIFFRKKHRPDFYYTEGEKKILVSPAAVDLGGLIILPRAEDLEKLTEEKIKNMYREVRLGNEYKEYLQTKIAAFYS